MTCKTHFLCLGLSDGCEPVLTTDAQRFVWERARGNQASAYERIASYHDGSAILVMKDGSAVYKPGTREASDDGVLYSAASLDDARAQRAKTLRDGEQ